ncbi:hypothetical protein E7Z59_10315 [Robertkochia marina]|uniref:DoxX family membrane protein n=1 Tax=Robertkochia marina TaxID=1227945 RepID=A0A4S3M107_9FLAO|nr:hypothetical protein [Robertkochia marina]THD68031.1 hypothetical protein E7Z59_10315 [Robertkochia marina]TRZ42685.1 hypothetical protein D3A96_11650 [Robertkochia marina]
MENKLASKVLNVIKQLAIWYLSIKMICFAIPKILFMQFRVLHYESFIPLAELSKYQHMWSFFGRSYNYNLFIGLMELLIGILIIFKRTRLIALLISLGVCLNIFILNIEFDIYFAIQHITLDLLITVILLLEYRKDLYKFFIELGGRIQSVDISEKNVLNKLKLLYILVLPVGYFIYAQSLKENYNNQLVGSYELKKFELNHTKINYSKGKYGSDPMLFLEHNNQIGLSINDSIYLGWYSITDDIFKAVFNPPANDFIRNITGTISNKSINGVFNDSLEVKIEFERLDEAKDYLNVLYTE